MKSQFPHGFNRNVGEAGLEEGDPQVIYGIRGLLLGYLELAFVIVRGQGGGLGLRTRTTAWCGGLAC
jgi:hypothetical protein